MTKKQIIKQHNEIMRKGIIAENKYRKWLSKQPDAIKDVKEFLEKAKTIEDKKDKIKYLRNAKHELDSKFLKKYKIVLSNNK